MASDANEQGGPPLPAGIAPPACYAQAPQRLPPHQISPGLVDPSAQEIAEGEQGLVSMRSKTPTIHEYAEATLPDPPVHTVCLEAGGTYILLPFRQPPGADYVCAPIFPPPRDPGENRLPGSSDFSSFSLLSFQVLEGP